MSTQTIFIQASDVWLFRTGRPFAAGEQSRATSLFPPTPRTMQGAIRSARIAQSGASFTNPKSWPPDVGTPSNFGALHLRGPLPAERLEDGTVRPRFPLPKDVVKLKTGWNILSPSSKPEHEFTANWNSKLKPLFPQKEGEPEKFHPDFLDSDTFFAYLSGQPPSDDGLGDALFERESRFGVQIDGRPKRPTEGMLYQVEYIRPGENAGLLIEVTGIELATSGLLQLGGEARAGRYETVSTCLQFPTHGRLNTVAQSQPLRFKLCLATPAIFDKGWLPKDIDLETLSGTWKGIDVTLVSAAVDKPQPIGGRDISERDKQRPIHRAVPAGSVYFFETQATTDEVLKAFDGNRVSDLDAQIGFGLGYVGGWQYV